MKIRGVPASQLTVGMRLADGRRIDHVVHHGMVCPDGREGDCVSIELHDATTEIFLESAPIGVLVGGEVAG